MKSRQRFRHGLFAIIVAAIALHGQLAAQSDAASIEASVTVLSGSVAVTPEQDLTFGSHFASAGNVQQESPGLWTVEADDIAVDLMLSILPSELMDGSGNAVPLSYGEFSFAANCDDPELGPVTKTADPGMGITDCVPFGEFGNVGLAGITGNLLNPVFVDLTGAPPGTYTAVIELTATVH